MNVLMIATEKLPVPPVRGGAIQTYITGVAPILARHHRLTILGRTDPALPQRNTERNITYERVESEGSFKKYKQAVTAFLKGKSYDLIHIFNRPRLVLPVAEMVPGARIILSMHNDMFIPRKITPEEAVKVIAKVERIITVSNYVGHAIQNLYPQAAAKLRTIYSGVDLNRFSPALAGKAMEIRESLQKKYRLEGRKVILFVGRLSPKKGADILIEAVQILAKKDYKIGLVLVGSKWYGENKRTAYVAYLQALAQRSRVPVVATEFVSPEEIHHWYWAGDIFVCPSQWQEPLARVLYEAMASGLPIVTTKRGGNPEIIGGSGLVVENAGDAKELAAKIAQLLDNPALCRQMGAKSRALAEERFGWARVAQEILAVWGNR
ncbi:MAG: glycosyltransferase family 4 protein [Clostridia bacterium]|nr:glycosyltransferase family 4 protein [Clostridia bacterium]